MKEAIVNPEAVKALAEDVEVLNSNASMDIVGKTAYTGDAHSAPAGINRCTSSATNIPVVENGYLTVVYRADNTKCLQYVTDSGVVYLKTLRNGSWGSWSQLALNSDLTNLDSKVAIKRLYYEYNDNAVTKTYTLTRFGIYLIVVTSFAGSPRNADAWIAVGKGAQIDFTKFISCDTSVTVTSLSDTSLQVHANTYSNIMIYQLF